jgi:hypothetical protein
MVKKIFTTSQIRKITAASRHESIPIPFYYTPPFLDELRRWIESRLSSHGGRPTIEGLDVIRKVRFSKETWQQLNLIAESLSQSDVSISPAQVASSILEEVISAGKLEKRGTNKSTKRRSSPNTA